MEGLAAASTQSRSRAWVEQALPVTKAELAKEPAGANLWVRLGGAYMLLGDEAEALRAGQKAAGKAPGGRAPEIRRTNPACRRRESLRSSTTKSRPAGISGWCDPAFF